MWFCLFRGAYIEGFASVGDSNSDLRDLGQFKVPTEEETMKFLEQKHLAKNTESKIQWASKLYKDWWFHHVKMADCDLQIHWCNLDALNTLNQSNLSVMLCRFVSEIRRQDGCEFPGQTLYQIVIILQLYLEKRGFDFKLISYCS